MWPLPMMPWSVWTPPHPPRLVQICSLGIPTTTTWEPPSPGPVQTCLPGDWPWTERPSCDLRNGTAGSSFSGRVATKASLINLKSG